jgi:hypothetical protein
MARTRGARGRWRLGDREDGQDRGARSQEGQEVGDNDTKMRCYHRPVWMDRRGGGAVIACRGTRWARPREGQGCIVVIASGGTRQG